MRKRLSVVALAAVAALSGCAVVVQVDDTKVKAQNDLTNLDVTVNGSRSSVSAIDLNDVQIGDVLFTLIEGGAVTPAVVTNRSGSVTITIDQADVWTPVLGGVEVSVPITGIDPMDATIEAGTTNTVVFDETTAGVILTAVAKKRAN